MSTPAILRRPWTEWHFMVVLSLAWCAVMLGFKIRDFDFGIPYVHLLVTYEFGLIKRGLLGEIVSLFTDSVPKSAVIYIGVSVWLVAVALFIAAFRKVYGLTSETLPLFAMLVSSPLFLKNYMFLLGYLDIFGFSLAALALILPVGVLYVPVIAVLSLILLLFHHLHFLLYLPAVFLVVLVRGCILSKASPARLAVLGLSIAAGIALFVKLVSFSLAPVPREVFVPYLQGRAAETLTPLVVSDIDIWYLTIETEIARTRALFLKNAIRLPIYLLVLALHAMIILHFRNVLRAIGNVWHRRLIWVAILGISLGYVVIGYVTFDYARWVANWAVCMMLVMMTAKLLPQAPADASPAPPVADRPRSRVFGWVLAAMPRLGVTVPF